MGVFVAILAAESAGSFSCDLESSIALSLWFLIGFLVYLIFVWLEDYPGFDFLGMLGLIKSQKKMMNLVDSVWVLMLSARSMALASAL